MTLLNVPGMKMRNLLFGLLLGLLAVVNSTPVHTVTQIPGKAEDDVFREAVTDGFLVERSFLPSLTTESPKRNTTVQASQHLSSASTVEDNTEKTLLSAATTVTVSHGQSSTTLKLPEGDSTSASTTSQRSQSSFTSSSLPSVTPDHTSASQTTDPAVSKFHFLSTQSSDSGSGDGEMFDQHSTTTFSPTSQTQNKETSSSPSTSTAAVPVMFEGDGSGGGSGDGPGSGLPRILMPTTIKINPQVTDKIVQAPVVENNPPIPAPINGHTTPGWMIILGFIVGLAALVMLFVAIATRDKWNGPRQTSQHETKANAANQQRELEMETFLHTDGPKENGKTGEYTVIPLDELPERYSSH